MTGKNVVCCVPSAQFIQFMMKTVNKKAFNNKYKVILLGCVTENENMQFVGINWLSSINCRLILVIVSSMTVNALFTGGGDGPFSSAKHSCNFVMTYHFP